MEFKFVGALMMARVMEKAAREEEKKAKDEDRLENPFPGKRWINEGGLEGFNPFATTRCHDNAYRCH